MFFSFFEWCENTLIGTVVRDSTWAFPLIGAVHLLGLGLLGGALLVVDLKMLGVGLKRQGITELINQTHVWLIGAVVLMTSTGLLLFLSEAIKCYYNTSFWVKMTTLPVALTFTFFARSRLARSGAQHVSVYTKMMGFASLGLWFTVAAAGRWIGFSS